jgi:hypothetical protein
MDLKEIGIDGTNWIRLAQDRPNGGFCEHGDEPSGSIKKAGFFYRLNDYQIFKYVLHHGVSIKK